MLLTTLSNRLEGRVVFLRQRDFLKPVLVRFYDKPGDTSSWRPSVANLEPADDDLGQLDEVAFKVHLHHGWMG